MSKDIITPKGYRFVILWAAALVLFYALVGYFGTRQLRGYRAETAQMRKTWLETVTTGIASAGAPEANSEAVRVGIYVNRVGEIAVHELGWSADFDLWFDWTNKGLDPGETFQVSNGEIETREKREAHVNGAERYERYRVKARMAKYFDPTRFPFADEPLLIQIEDGVHGVDALNFVADTKNSAVSPTAIVHDLSRSIEL
jgi:hypothetical protein